MSEISNAQIEKVSLTMRDHGCLTYYIDLRIGKGSFCSYGGYCIGHGYLGADHFDGMGAGLEAMMRIMDVVGVENWEELNGKYCRVEHDGWGSTIKRIGNLLEDKWFDQEEFFSRSKQAT